MSIWRGLKRMLGGTAAPPPRAEDLFAAEVAARISQLPGVTSVDRGEQFSIVYAREGATKRPSSATSSRRP